MESRVRALCEKHASACQHLRIREISKRFGCSLAAVSVALRDAKIDSYSTKLPWHLVDWRLDNQDIAEIIGAKTRSISQARYALDGGCSRDRAWPGYNSALDKMIEHVTRFNANRERWLSQKSLD